MQALIPFPVHLLRHTAQLRTIEDTERLGAALAQALARINPGSLLLFGPLGAGKTTLCRALVSSLPGGDEAEISSPSFTICNIYCTEPAVHHYDLYRQQPGGREESLEESFDAPSILTIVEWPEHMDIRSFPADGLAMRFSVPEGSGERLAEISPLGPLGEQFLGCVFNFLV